MTYRSMWVFFVIGCFFAGWVYAQEAPVTVYIPSKNVIATKPYYTLKGKVGNVSALKIDGKIVTRNAKGFFSFPVKVKALNQSQTISFKALTDDYKVVSFSRQIYFEAPTHLPAKATVAPVTSTTPTLLSKRVTKTVATLPNPLPRPTVSEPVKSSKKRVKRVVSKPRIIAKAAITPVFQKPDPSPTLVGHVVPAIPMDSPPINLAESIQPVSLIETTIMPPTSPIRSLPVVFVKSPQNNMVTYEPSVILEGSVRYAREFFINNRAIKVDKDGRFSETFPLPEIGKFIFNLYALGDEGLSTTVIRKVFRIEHEVVALEKAKSKPEKNVDDVAAKLARKITVDLQDAELSDVIKILAEKGDLNIVTDKTLSGTVHLTLNNVTIQDALDYILNTQGLAYKMVENTILIGLQENLDKATRLETKVIRLDNIQAKDVATILGDQLKGQEKVQANDQENILIINADSKKMASLVDLVARLDEKKVSQIILEAQFLEVNQSSLENLGVAWSNAYGIGAQGSYSDGAFTYVSNLSISTILNLLKNNGDARILAKPRIKAVDKEPAEIFIGDSIPYIELVSDTSGRTQQSVKFIESGVLLKILPDINPFTQEIKVKFEPEVSYVNGFGGPNNDIPIVRRRKVSTVVNIRNGQTVLIGGLFNSSDSDTYSRFPLLSKIPVLGVFFKSSKNQKDQTELVIAVTPRIIDENYAEPSANIGLK